MMSKVQFVLNVERESIPGAAEYGKDPAVYFEVYNSGSTKVASSSDDARRNLSTAVPGIV